MSTNKISLDVLIEKSIKEQLKLAKIGEILEYYDNQQRDNIEIVRISKNTLIHKSKGLWVTKIITLEKIDETSGEYRQSDRSILSALQLF